MSELQELDGPFHISQTPTAQFRVGGWVSASRQPFGIYPRLDPTDLDDVGLR